MGLSVPREKTEAFRNGQGAMADSTYTDLTSRCGKSSLYGPAASAPNETAPALEWSWDRHGLLAGGEPVSK